MKKNISFLVLYCLFLTCTTAFAQVNRVEKGNLMIENIPDIPQDIMLRMQQYQNVRSASLQGWLPDGRGMIISTRFGETTQLHLVEAPGGARKQITFFEEPVNGASVNPVSTDFLFTRDVGGSEYYQIFHYDLASGKYRMLTDGASRNGFALWSNKGDRFSFYSTKRNKRDWDVYVANPNNPEQANSVLENTGTWIAVDWSPDDSKLLILKYVSATESYLHYLSLDSKKLTQVNPSEEKIAYGGQAWSKDGKGVYFTSDAGSEFKRLQYYDMASHEITMVTGGIQWDVSSFELADDGSRLAYITNEDGISKLHILDLQSKEEMQLPDLPVGQIYGLDFRPEGNQLGLVLNTPQTPGDVYVLDLGTSELVRWTYSEVGGLSTDNFVTPDLIHYETFDKVEGKPRMIPAFYFKPEDTDGLPAPVLISIHGGPEGQFRPFFRSTIQYHVNELGIAVLAPNVRGSSGYGKSYLKLDNGYKREDTVKDIGKLLDWIAARPELDENRVAVIGGSYGGYMVLAAMTHFNDRLRAGIDIVGISNFVTFLENTKAYRRDLRRVEYGDERDPDMRAFLNKISPNNNADKISKPMFIAQGANDPRVPASESEQMVEVIRKNGGQVWYMLAKDEGHGFRKKSNRDYYNHATVLFLQTFLLGEETTLR